MDLRKPLDHRALLLMILTCFSFATQQIALKATAADIAPVLQIGLRSLGAAVLVAILMAWDGTGFRTALKSWRAGLMAGALFTAEFFTLGEGLRHTSAAHAVIFLYSAPIFAALGLHLRLPSERLSPLAWAGVLVAFGGIAVAFLGPSIGHAGSMSAAVLWGDLLCLAAGAMWGATTVLIRTTSLSQLPAKPTLLYQLAMAAVLLPLSAWMMGVEAPVWTPLAMASLAYQSLIVSFAIMLLWFWLLRHYLASRLGVLSFLTPLFGVLLGIVLLDETLEWAFVVGAIMVVLGIFLVSGGDWILHKLGFAARPIAPSAPASTKPNCPAEGTS